MRTKLGNDSRLLLGGKRRKYKKKEAIVKSFFYGV